MDQKIWELLRKETMETEDAFRYLQVRAEFANFVSKKIRHFAKLDQDKKIPAIYAVWLNGQSKPVYIGQTQDSKRRLWDLAIGESHHLANTFPPEIWGKVCVFKWKEFLDNHKETFEVLKEKSMQFDTSDEQVLKQIGLAIELFLQIREEPLFNKYKRFKNGKLKIVNFNNSKSIGAKLLNQLDTEFADLITYWDELTAFRMTGLSNGAYFEYGGIVFPSKLLE